MGKEKIKYSLKGMIWMGVLCLVVCLMLVAGTSLARYETRFLTQSYTFTASQDSIHVYGGNITDAAYSSDSWSRSSARWEMINSSAKATFCVTNGSAADSFAGRDQSFSISVIAGQSISDHNKLAVTLFCTDEEGNQISAVGTAEVIAEGTSLYSAYGAGWVYRFFDGEGNELTFDLEGGELQYHNFTVTVTGNVASSLLELKISGQYTD